MPGVTSLLLSIFIIFPPLAFVPAVLFFLAGKHHALRSGYVTGFLWASYGMYESLVYLRIICDAECNIRVDLLIIYPLLCLSSFIALALLMWHKRLIRKQQSS